MEKVFCEKCSSKHIVFGLYTELVKDRLVPSISAVCGECHTRAVMPAHSIEEFIIEDLVDHSHFNPQDYTIARAYPIWLLLELDSHNKCESLCCDTPRGWQVLQKENAIKCYACERFYNPIHIVQQQLECSREEAIEHLVSLQYTRLSPQEM